MILQYIFFWFLLGNVNISFDEYGPVPYINEDLQYSGKSYKCSFCSYASNIKGNVHTHMAFHTGIRPYKCAVCQRAFTLKHHLQRHVLLHTGEKPFKCDQCDKEYSRKTQLVHHKSTKH